jgi:LPXTG-motif cell wall-anchored protein
VGNTMLLLLGVGMLVVGGIMWMRWKQNGEDDS